MRSQLLLCLGLVACSPAWAKKVDLDYQVRLLPASGQAEVRLTLAEAVRYAAWTSTWARPMPTAASRPTASGSSRASGVSGTRPRARPASATG